MQDELVIGLDELTKLYTICPAADCGAEIGFDLTQKKPYVQQVSCPSCQTTLFEVAQQEGFRYTWPSFIRLLVQAQGKPRMFFRVKRPAG